MESVFGGGRVAEVHQVSVAEDVVDARRSLVLVHALLRQIEKVVCVVACTHYGGLTHHRHSAHIHCVGLRRVLG